MTITVTAVASRHKNNNNNISNLPRDWEVITFSLPSQVGCTYTTIRRHTSPTGKTVCSVKMWSLPFHWAMETETPAPIRSLSWRPGPTKLLHARLVFTMLFASVFTQCLPSSIDGSWRRRGRGRGWGWGPGWSGWPWWSKATTTGPADKQGFLHFNLKFVLSQRDTITVVLQARIGQASKHSKE